ncbi:MAG: THUMP domain-containing protein [Methanomassiliicoccales archaeon]
MRYAEIGLKSQSVRRRFESLLVDNILNALAAAGLEGLVLREHGRIFVETADLERAAKALSRVFGIASISLAERCSSDMEEMKSVIASFSQPFLHQGQSFAVRARRTGDHPFTSMDMARELGSAIYLANQWKEVGVNLDSPDVEFFVEARDNKAYIFTSYIPGPGGLPLGSQGKVLAVIAGERDALAAWLLMKRGCKVVAMGEENDPGINLLRKWDSGMKIMTNDDIEEAAKRHRAMAIVFGYTLNEFEKIKSVDARVPAFFPLVGMDEKEIEKRLERIKA